jgi:hypothetical protein
MNVPIHGPGDRSGAAEAHQAGYLPLGVDGPVNRAVHVSGAAECRSICMDVPVHRVLSMLPLGSRDEF